MLTDKQLDFFHEEGYLLVEELFTDADLQPVIDEMTAEVDSRARALVASGELSSTYADEGFETRLAKISAETDVIAKAIWSGVLSGPAIFGLISNPKLLDLAESLCGPELIASSVYRLRPKIPNYHFGAVPWHQDSGYFEPYCDNSLVLTVWLPLVDATPERGCLWVLPRVHKSDILPHCIDPEAGFYLRIMDENIPTEQKPVCVPVPKRGVLLLTNKTPHVSYENNTDVVRWSMDLRYQNAALPTNANITRLEGEDVPSADNGIPIACYPPEADFLVRSISRPDEVVTDPAVFHDLRTSYTGALASRWELG